MRKWVDVTLKKQLLFWDWLTRNVFLLGISLLLLTSLAWSLNPPGQTAAPTATPLAGTSTAQAASPTPQTLPTLTPVQLEEQMEEITLPPGYLPNRDLTNNVLFVGGVIVLIVVGGTVSVLRRKK